MNENKNVEMNTTNNAGAQVPVAENTGKDNSVNRFLKTVALLLLILAVCVSAAILGIRLGQMADSDDAISLIPTTEASGDDISQDETQVEETTADAGESEAETGEVGDGETVEESTGTPFVPRPSFVASDDNCIWTTDTTVEIFRFTYEDGNGEIKVQADNGDKLIAPGTNNTYTFKFKNNGNIPIDYVMDVEAHANPANITLPVKVRMNRYDSGFLIGGDHEWAPVGQLNDVSDGATLAPNRYAYYTLEWKWPYDGVDDNYDTVLGEMAAEGQNITLTIRIKTVATANVNATNVPGGALNTGDNSNMILWIALLVVSAGGMLILLLILRRKKDEEDADEQPREEA